MQACFALLLALLLIAPARAEKRVALVIGNAAYQHAPTLANPRNDAEGLAAALKRLGFDVLLGVDLDKRALEGLLQRFSEQLEKADVALVFYAGHGLQVNGRNYLVPVDGKLDREADLHFQAVSLDLVQSLMEQSQRTSIMILDACRDNPLARNLARSMGTRSTSIGRGLGETKAGIGTLIVYATQPGNVALDGEGKNSPFTAALLVHLEAPGLEIRQVLTRVRQSVIETTKGKQVPWDSSSLTGDVFLVAKPATPPAGTTPPATTTPPPDNETLYWASIKDGSNISHFKAYLARWPKGVFADLARSKIDELESAAARAEEEQKRKDDQAMWDDYVKTQQLQYDIQNSRSLLASKRYAEVKTAIEAVKAKWAKFRDSGSPSAEKESIGRDVAALGQEVGAALAAHAKAEAGRARQLIRAQRLDEAKRILDEAAKIDEASPDLAAARREYEAARAKAATVRKPDAAPPATPRPGGSPTAEIRRKALAKELDNGFCASTPWPTGGGELVGVAGAGLFSRDGVIIRNEIAYKYGSSFCEFRRIVRVGKTEKGVKCAIEERSACWPGSTCSYSRRIFTLEPGNGGLRDGDGGTCR